MLRQPIVCVLGHVDHGKTTLLDAIRETAVAGREAGGITQHVSASEVPVSAIKEHCGQQLQKMKIDLTLPGLLFIDTPGHEAFVNLRKRGGSIADIAILVVDVNQGIQNQTREAIGILKQYKTPFVVAATKIDQVTGWKPRENSCFADSFPLQRKDVQEYLDKKLYQLVGQLSEYGFSSERYDRVGDFTKQIVIIPVSGRNGEGISELLLFVAGLAQRFLELQLEKKENALAKGSILEVKEEKGLGMTLDVILYEGTLEEGESIVFLSKQGEVLKSRIKALLKPNNSEEAKKSGEKYVKVKSVTAASGIKIACENAEQAIAGSSLYEYDEGSEGKTGEALKEEYEEIEIESTNNGIIIKADALGSLEAIVRLFQNEKIPIRKANIGVVSRQEVLEAANISKTDKYLGVIFSFNLAIDPEVREIAEKEGAKLFEEKIIYNLVEGYKRWRDEEKDRERKEAFSSLTLPAKLFLMPGHCFRVSNPAIFGVQILEGRIRKENRLMNEKGEVIGEIRSIQVEKDAVDEAKKGQEVAIAVDGPFYGRQVREKQELFTDISAEEIEAIEKKYVKSLSDGERQLLNEIKRIKGIISFEF
ncbi:MAG: translation initiation factor IF-2 [Candidatus Micrarchaeota archaeon]